MSVLNTKNAASWFSKDCLGLCIMLMQFLPEILSGMNICDQQTKKSQNLLDISICEVDLHEPNK